MLAVTSPVLRIDAARVAQAKDAASAHAGWQAHRDVVATYERHREQAQADLIAKRSSFVGKLLGHKPEVSPIDLLDAVRQAARKPDLLHPDAELARQRRFHPAMDRIDAAEAERLSRTDVASVSDRAMIFVAVAAAGSDVVQRQRKQHADAFLAAVGQMQDALSARRFAGFWDAAAAATTAASQVAAADRTLGQIATWWTGGAMESADRIRLAWALREALETPKLAIPVPLADAGEAQFIRTSDDRLPDLDRAGTNGRAALADGANGAVRLVQPLTVSVDPDLAAAMADAHARFAEALLAADGDYELAMIGQQYRTREVIIESACRMEQAIGRMGAMLLGQMRANAAYLGARIAANTAAVQEAAGAATTANARLIGAVQAAGDRIDASLGRIPAGWRVG